MWWRWRLVECYGKYQNNVFFFFSFTSFITWYIRDILGSLAIHLHSIHSKRTRDYISRSSRPEGLVEQKYHWETGKNLGPGQSYRCPVSPKTAKNAFFHFINVQEMISDHSTTLLTWKLIALKRYLVKLILISKTDSWSEELWYYEIELEELWIVCNFNWANRMKTRSKSFS